jgi:hypothetical protein
MRRVLGGGVVLVGLALAVCPAAAERYCNGQATKVKGALVYPNGKPMFDGKQCLYPDGKPTIKDAKLLYPNGHRVVIAETPYYPNGRPALKGRVYFLPNRDLFSSGGVVYLKPGVVHPNPPKTILYFEGALRFEFPVKEGVPTLTTFQLEAKGPDYTMRFKVSDGVISDLNVDCSPPAPIR